MQEKVTKSGRKFSGSRRRRFIQRLLKALAQVGQAQPRYIPMILSALRKADLSKYKDSMRPLIQRDIIETEKLLEAAL